MLALPRWSQVLLVLVVAAWLGACLWAADRLTAPPRHRPLAPPRGAGLSTRELRLTTADGLELAAWAVEPATPARAVCLLVHHLGGCRSAPRAAFVASRGLAVLALDLRGHGESEGERSGLGWHERADLHAAAEEARRRWPGLPLIGWGTSAGAAALVYSVDPGAPDGAAPLRLDGLVLEALYLDIDTAFQRTIVGTLGRWALPLAWPIRPFGAWLADLDERALSPERALERLAGLGADAPPLLLATGSADPLATAEDLARLSAAGGGRAVVVRGGHHGDLGLQDGGSWVATLGGFLRAAGR